MYVGIGLAFALFLALYFVYQVRAVMLVLLLTLLFSVIISRPVDYLARKGLGRGLGTLIVLGTLTLALVLGGVALGSVVESQAQQLAEDLPTLLSSAQDFAEEVQSRFGLNISLPGSQQLLDSARSFLSGGAFSTFVSVGASVANVVSFVAVVPGAARLDDDYRVALYHSLVRDRGAVRAPSGYFERATSLYPVYRACDLRDTADTPSPRPGAYIGAVGDPGLRGGTVRGGEHSPAGRDEPGGLPAPRYHRLRAPDHG